MSLSSTEVGAASGLALGAALGRGKAFIPAMAAGGLAGAGVGRAFKGMKKKSDMVKYTKTKTAMWSGFFDEMEKLAIRIEQFLARQEML